MKIFYSMFFVAAVVIVGANELRGTQDAVPQDTLLSDEADAADHDERELGPQNWIKCQSAYYRRERMGLFKWRYTSEAWCVENCIDQNAGWKKFLHDDDNWGRRWRKPNNAEKMEIKKTSCSNRREYGKCESKYRLANVGTLRAYQCGKW